MGVFPPGCNLPTTRTLAVAFSGAISISKIDLILTVRRDTRYPRRASVAVKEGKYGSQSTKRCQCLSCGILSLYVARRYILAIAGVLGVLLLFVFMIDVIELLRRTIGTEIDAAALISLSLMKLPRVVHQVLPLRSW